jgi:hypothetical protein
LGVDPGVDIEPSRSSRHDRTAQIRARRSRFDDHRARLTDLHRAIDGWMCAATTVVGTLRQVGLR